VYKYIPNQYNKNGQLLEFTKYKYKKIKLGTKEYLENVLYYSSNNMDNTN